MYLTSTELLTPVNDDVQCINLLPLEYVTIVVTLFTVSKVLLFEMK